MYLLTQTSRQALLSYAMYSLTQTSRQAQYGMYLFLTGFHVCTKL
uniref:Uncharacterized protein n=1 Tax=Anguilla anguilla TaxID=7936 RepID=A0A0E9WCR0_ANGAN